MGPEHWVYSIPLRLRSLFRRPVVEQELDEELRWHLERQSEDYIARGMSPEEARRAALQAMGGLERRKDECRDARRLNLIENLTRDVRFAFRALRRSPGFTIVSVLTLALGIGAATAIFTVINAVLLRPLGYLNPSELVVLQHERMGTVAPATFLDWQAGTHAFAQMGMAEYWTPNMTGGDKAEELTALHMNASILALLGVKPVLGRFFLPEEEHSGRDHVLVLSYDFWNSRFGGDRGVVGRSLVLDGARFSIVGVMPPGFRFAPYWATNSQFWAPLVLDERRTDRSGASLRVFARLRAGTTLEEARAELAAVADRIGREYPGSDQRATVIPLREKVVGDVRQPLLILLAAVGLIMLIACANVAHLQLMRAAVREREFALRTALGGSRGRLIQQSLVESGVLSVAGGLVGLALAWGGVRALVALAPPGLPRLETISMDGRVYFFALIVVGLAGLMFGVAPALAASRTNVHRSLKEGGRSTADSSRRRRIRGALVVSEFAMALVLLVGAGLVIKSFLALIAVDAGFDPHNTISLKVSVRGTSEADPIRRLAFFRELVSRVKALAGVVQASAINHVPLNGDDWHFGFDIEGRPPVPPEQRPSANFLIVHPGYFATMGIPVIMGRDFTSDDVSNATHVVIVSRLMARRYWPGETPIGRRISVDDATTHPDWFTIVGVAKDVRQGSWSDIDSEEMYFPTMAGAGYPWNAAPLVTYLNPLYMTLVVRTGGNAGSLVTPIEDVVGSMDRDVAISQVATMEEAIDQQFTQPRFYLLLLGAFAGAALLLSAVGVYGVMSYSVARRSHEIGVRLALGAERLDAFLMVARQGLALAAWGGLAGIVVALGVTRYLRTLLYEVQPTDLATFGSGAILLAGVAVVACWIPAWRASRVNPMQALRYE